MQQLRESFLTDLGPALRYTGAACLAWSVLVEASLLEHQLIKDMQQTLASKGGGRLPACEGLSFVGPRETLSPEARQAFQEYVALRWPILVFALDPVTQDQNVADSFSRRRELQLAAAVAVATGNLSPSAAGKFVRRMESDLETIALHRTDVGFSHGGDTFGWRFFPRVQTPATPGTLGAFGQTLFGGPSRDRERRSWCMEPAQHECMAIVIMPSFVPYVAIESRSNWFALNDPERKELTLRDAMRISNTYQRVRCDVQQLSDSRWCRADDVARLTTAIDQLEQRLPLQMMTVQVPHENTLGGFDMFESGVSGLGPELDGWYGAPGLDLNSPTTIFLVGDRFSVLETRVIVGGREAPFRMLSRQVLEVQAPPAVLAVDAQGSLVDVHLATPYGASSHLLIPVAARAVASLSTAIVDPQWVEPAPAAEIRLTEDGKSASTAIGALSIRAAPIRRWTPRFEWPLPNNWERGPSRWRTPRRSS